MRRERDTHTRTKAAKFGSSSKKSRQTQFFYVSLSLFLSQFFSLCRDYFFVVGPIEKVFGWLRHVQLFLPSLLGIDLAYLFTCTYIFYLLTMLSIINSTSTNLCITPTHTSNAIHTHTQFQCSASVSNATTDRRLSICNRILCIRIYWMRIINCSLQPKQPNFQPTDDSSGYFSRTNMIDQ